jgi:hypothetical protein
MNGSCSLLCRTALHIANSDPQQSLQFCSLASLDVVEDGVSCMLACFLKELADDFHYCCAMHHQGLACLFKCL